jgi:hypothetical protein
MIMEIASGFEMFAAKTKGRGAEPAAWYALAPRAFGLPAALCLVQVRVPGQTSVK